MVDIKLLTQEQNAMREGGSLKICSSLDPSQKMGWIHADPGAEDVGAGVLLCSGCRIRGAGFGIEDPEAGCGAQRCWSAESAGSGYAAR